jgi:hypothetical protein
LRFPGQRHFETAIENGNIPYFKVFVAEDHGGFHWSPPSKLSPLAVSMGLTGQLNRYKILKCYKMFRDL